MADRIKRGESCPVFPESPPSITPEAGEIWKVSFPQACQAGHEMHGVRRCIVISEDHSHRFGIRLVVMLTTAKPRDCFNALAVVLPGPTGGLDKASTAWAFNVRACDLRRFACYTPLGKVSEDDLAAIRLVVRTFSGA